MTGIRTGLAVLLAIAAACAAPAQAPDATNYHHFAWQEAAPGVWFGITTPDDFQSGNVAIVTLPQGGSLVVDTQDAPFIAREIITKAREIGHGPVKYVVNTHLHQDHVGGNAAFVADNPAVQIIAHAQTCKQIPRDTIPRMKARLEQQLKDLAALEAKRTAMASGDPGRAALDHRIEGLRLYLDQAPTMRWAMPTECLNLAPGGQKVITDGGRRIEIRYFGRAHSTGDLVVYLPREKVAMVGDLWGQETGYPFLDAGLDGRDGSVLATPGTLRGVRALDFNVALTGHSAVIHGKASLDAAIAGGDAIIAQIRKARDSGQTVTALLQQMPPPAGAPPFLADVWKTVLINGFEEMQVREQMGLPPLDVPAKP